MARHGPYWRDRITVACFDPTAIAVEEARLRVWAEQFEELPGQLRAALETELYAPLHAATSLYQLRDLGQDAFHD